MTRDKKNSINHCPTSRSSQSAIKRPLADPVVGHDMTKAKLLGIAALLALSVWIGLEIDPDRDWMAWLFIAALPIAI